MSFFFSTSSGGTVDVDWIDDVMAGLRHTPDVEEWLNSPYAAHVQTASRLEYIKGLKPL